MLQAMVLRRLMPWFLADYLAGCQSLALGPPPLAAKICFLLTFDDEPSARDDFSPTRLVLEQLAADDVQNHIKAIFSSKRATTTAAAPRSDTT